MSWKRTGAVVLTLLVLLSGVAAWLYRERITRAWWLHQTSRPLDEAQGLSLANCEDPGWIGLIRVIHHDLDVPCDPGWVLDGTAPHLTGLRRAWAQERLREPGTTPRQRFRWAGALHLAGQHVPDLSLLVSDAELPPAERAWVLDQLQSQSWERDWVDPVLARQVAARELSEGVLESAPVVARHLWLLSLGPPTADLSQARPHYRTSPSGVVPEEWGERQEKEWLASMVLELVGLDRAVLQSVEERRGRGMPVHHLPLDLLDASILVERDCADLGSPECLALAATLLERHQREVYDGVNGGQESTGSPHPAEVHLPDPLWTVLYDDDEYAVEMAGVLLGSLAMWVGEAAPVDRPSRLIGSLTSGRRLQDETAVRRGYVGDPLHVLVHRAASPWATALAALAVGQAVSVEVHIESYRRGVVLGVGGRRVGVGPCGSVFWPDPTPGPSWPERAVLAQATLEAAGGALRAGRQGKAMRLVHLAAALDPVATEDVVQAVEGATEGETDRLVGAIAGSLVRPMAAPSSDAAAARRGTRARVLRDVAPVGDCPATLGM